MKRDKIYYAIGILMVAVFLVFTAFPLYWLLITSFKERLEVIGGISFWPGKFFWRNYYRPLFEDVYASYIRNSFIISSVEIIICLPPALLAAYAFSRLKFKADNHFLFWFLTNRMAPPVAFLIPYYALYTFLKLFDTLQGLIIINSIGNLPFVIWLLKGFIDGIPKDVEEAAFIDGYTFWQMLRRILLPMLKPAIVVAGLFVFIFTWNEMLFASLLTTSPAAMPLTGGLLHYMSQLWMNWGEIAALTLITMAPILVGIFYLQKYIARALTFGAVR
ncbi:carbohydrate ABC transporter permease [Candidatus Bathyarchaeota archaeon]|nr:carbohydrate ABC transporter permease [Candidatus Bathyarchaeota archaeon]